MGRPVRTQEVVGGVAIEMLGGVLSQNSGSSPFDVIGSTIEDTTGATGR